MLKYIYYRLSFNKNSKTPYYKKNRKLKRIIDKLTKDNNENINK